MRSLNPTVNISMLSHFSVMWPNPCRLTTQADALLPGEYAASLLISFEGSSIAAATMVYLLVAGPLQVAFGSLPDNEYDTVEAIVHINAALSARHTIGSIKAMLSVAGGVLRPSTTYTRKLGTLDSCIEGYHIVQGTLRP